MCVYVYICVFVWRAHHVADCWAVVFFREWQVCPYVLYTLESHSKGRSVGSVFGSLQWGWLRTQAPLPGGGCPWVLTL